jgi:hypothetical protein
MVARGRRWDARHVRPVLLLASLAAPVTGVASAADQVVSGTVAPYEAVALGPAGQSAGGNEVSVAREWRGDTLYVTISPR